ncbi:MAG: hypothetical protein AAGG47_03865 [Pseudomonadota bacterium]
MTYQARRPGRLALWLLVVAFVAGHDLPALAQEWTVNANLRTGFSYTDNLALSDDDDSDDGPSLFSSTGLGLNARYQTDESNISVSTGFTARAKIIGDDGDDFRTATPSLNASAAFSLGRVSSNSSLNFRLDNVAFTEFSDTGALNSDGIFVDGSALRLDLSVGQSFGYALTQRNSVSVSTGASITRFSDSDEELEDSTSFFGSVGFSRAVSDRLSLNFSLSASRFTSDDEEQTRGTSFGASFGFSRRLLLDARIGGNLGVRVTNVTEDILFEPFGTDSETNIGFVGGFNFSYDLGRTRLGASIGQSISPNEDGDITESTRFGLSASRSIAPRQSVGLSLGVNRRTSITDVVGAPSESDQDLFGQISTSYRYQITENWRANLSYSFRVRNDSNETEFSNGVFLGFSRPFNLVN